MSCPFVFLTGIILWICPTKGGRFSVSKTKRCGDVQHFAHAHYSKVVVILHTYCRLLSVLYGWINLNVYFKQTYTYACLEYEEIKEVNDMKIKRVMSKHCSIINVNDLLMFGVIAIKHDCLKLFTKNFNPPINFLQFFFFEQLTLWSQINKSKWNDKNRPGRLYDILHNYAYIELCL